MNGACCSRCASAELGLDAVRALAAGAKTVLCQQCESDDRVSYLMRHRRSRFTPRPHESWFKNWFGDMR